MVSNPARLRLEHDQIVIAQQDEVSFPIEDISTLLIESRDVLITSSLLSRLAEYGVGLIVCDRSHMPCMAGLPLAGHSRLAGVQRMQLDTTAPFRKRCWQTVVVRKIRNQAQCLNILGRAKADMLESLADDVGSGDPDNLESVAARVYFDALFGSSFSRSDECVTNSALNYGYAIMRGAVARGLVAHGFLPAHGIHHRSELNQFNLADDFMEPFRPLVDLCVAEMRLSEPLCKRHRETLVSLLHAQVLIDGSRHSAHRAAELIASFYLAACRDKDPGLMTAPELLPIKMHSYE